MDSAFERGFVAELQACLAKIAGSDPGGPGEEAAPRTRPPSPFEAARAAGKGGASEGAARPRRPPGLHKGAGVASGLERLYLTLGPSAAAKKALRYATPRMDAHLVGRDAARLLAEHGGAADELLARGRRSAERARGVLEKGARAVEKTASPFGQTMQRLAQMLFFAQ